MFPNSRRWIGFMVCACLILSILPASQATAADTWVINVNTTADGRDFATNSVCSVGSPTGGPCTLRAALSEAYGHIHVYDTKIILQPTIYQLTIPPDFENNIHSGDLDIPGTSEIHTITITTNDPHNRAVIDANGLDRVLRIGEGLNIQLQNIVIRGGLLLLSDESPEGAGILNRGKLELHNVIIEDNEARCAQEPCPYVAGGGILNYGEVIMTSSTVRRNTSPDGSAIFNTLSSTPNSGRFVILNSTITNNHAAKYYTMINYGYMHLRNSTVSNNTASVSVGIANRNQLVIESSTLANAGQNASVHNDGEVSIEDSILVALPGPISYNCSSTLASTWISSGYNIFSDATCPSTGTDDLSNIDPKLGPLGNWGGLTMTRPLLAGSPAINHRSTACTTIPYSPILPPENLLFDQRGIDRNDGMCDSGAFEGTVDTLKVYLPLILK